MQDLILQENTTKSLIPRRFVSRLDGVRRERRPELPGVGSIEVRDPDETKRVIETIIACLDGEFGR